MKTFTLSNKTVPVSDTMVGTVQATGTDNTTYGLINKSQPADYTSSTANRPTVQAQGGPPPVNRRRQIMLVAS